MLKNLNGGFNENHHPSMRFEDLRLAPGFVALWRPGSPKERKIGSIVRPDGNRVEYSLKPNCAQIVAVGPNCKRSKVGDYAFWLNEGIDLRKPQRIVPEFTDAHPTVFVIREVDIIATTSEAAANEKTNTEND